MANPTRLAETIASVAVPPTDLDPSQPLVRSASSQDELDRVLINSVLDRYDIVGFIGAGEMGRVYRGFHRLLHRDVAIKVITPETVSLAPGRLELFHTEARSAARLNHPNIVDIYAIGEDRGFHFVELELVHGIDLKQHLAQQKPTLVDATRWAAQLASALQSAHERGIVHCDVKPSNALLTPAGTIKLTDFGLARAWNAHRSDRGNDLVGTPFYMAPELFEGETMSPATDMYSLGVTYYNLLTGELPYRAQSLDELKAWHRQATAFNLSTLSEQFDRPVADLLGKLLSRRPEDRLSFGSGIAQQLFAIANSIEPLSDKIERIISPGEIDWSIRPGEELASGYEDDLAVMVYLPGGRKQRIYLREIHEENFNIDMVQLWTPCSPACSANYEFALKTNAGMPFGALSLRDYHGQPFLIMLHNLNRDGISRQELHDAIVTLAHGADRTEQRLSGSDQF